MKAVIKAVLVFLRQWSHHHRKSFLATLKQWRARTFATLCALKSQSQIDLAKANASIDAAHALLKETLSAAAQKEAALRDLLIQCQAEKNTALTHLKSVHLETQTTYATVLSASHRLDHLEVEHRRLSNDLANAKKVAEYKTQLADTLKSQLVDLQQKYVLLEETLLNEKNSHAETYRVNLHLSDDLINAQSTLALSTLNYQVACSFATDAVAVATLLATELESSKCLLEKTLAESQLISNQLDRADTLNQDLSTSLSKNQSDLDQTASRLAEAQVALTDQLEARRHAEHRAAEAIERETLVLSALETFSADLATAVQELSENSDALQTATTSAIERWRTNQQATILAARKLSRKLASAKPILLKHRALSTSYLDLQRRFQETTQSLETAHHAESKLYALQRDFQHLKTTLAEMDTEKTLLRQSLDAANTSILEKSDMLRTLDIAVKKERGFKENYLQRIRELETQQKDLHRDLYHLREELAPQLWKAATMLDVLKVYEKRLDEQKTLLKEKDKTIKELRLLTLDAGIAIDTDAALQAA